MSNFTNILSVGPELCSKDGRKDVTELKVAFRNFANAPKN